MINCFTCTNAIDLFGFQYGSALDDCGNAITVTRQNMTFVAGQTFGNLFSDSLGGSDMFANAIDANGNIISSIAIEYRKFRY
jgi:hypothetical protein